MPKWTRDDDPAEVKQDRFARLSVRVACFETDPAMVIYSGKHA